MNDDDFKKWLEQIKVLDAWQALTLFKELGKFYLERSDELTNMNALDIAYHAIRAAEIIKDRSGD